MNAGLKYGAGIGAGLGGIKWLLDKDENKNLGSLAAHVGGGAVIGGGVGYGGSAIYKRAGLGQTTAKSAPRTIEITDDVINAADVINAPKSTTTLGLPALPASTKAGRRTRSIRKGSRQVETPRTEPLRPDFGGDSPVGSETLSQMGVDKRGAANPNKKIMGSEGTYRGKSGNTGDKSGVKFFDPYSVAKLWWAY